MMGRKRKHISERQRHLPRYLAVCLVMMMLLQMTPMGAFAEQAADTETPGTETELEQSLAVSAETEDDEVGTAAADVTVSEDPTAEVSEPESPAPEEPKAETPETDGADPEEAEAEEAEGEEPAAEEVEGEEPAAGETETFFSGTLYCAGEGLEAQVTAPAAAELPETVELCVREITEQDENYAQLLQQADEKLDSVKAEDEARTYLRLFDLRFAEGEEEREPAAPVQVEITVPNNEVPEGTTRVLCLQDTAAEQLEQAAYDPALGVFRFDLEGAHVVALTVTGTAAETRADEDAVSEEEANQTTEDIDDEAVPQASGAAKAPRKVSGSQVAADGVYSATVTATKTKNNKNYYGTVYVYVSDGKISGLRIYASDKQDRFQDALNEVYWDLVGQPATVTAVTAVDAVSSASLSGTSSGSSKYTIDLIPAIQRALASAEPASSGSSGTTAETVADGVYTGTGSMDNGHYITLDVTVSGGVITKLEIADADGSWDSLLSTESGNYIGGPAAVETVDAVSAATPQGYKAAIKTAVLDALGGAPTGGSGSGSGSGESTVSKIYYYDPDLVGEYSKGNGIYNQGLVGTTVTGKTFDGDVWVLDGATVTFKNCTFQTGHLYVETADAVAILDNCNFGTTDDTTEWGLEGVSNTQWSEVTAGTDITNETGIAFGMYRAVKSKSTTSTLQNSTVLVKPSWATATYAADSSVAEYIYTGKVPETEAKYQQSFSVDWDYGRFDLSFPMVLTIAPEDVPEKEAPVAEKEGYGLTLDKTATQKTGESNVWILDLYAGATGTVSGGGSSGTTDAGKAISPGGSATIAVGETVTLEGTYNSMASSSDDRWSSSNTSVATVEKSNDYGKSNAIVTGKSAGTVTITHKIDTLVWGSTTETFTITVTAAASGGNKKSDSTLTASAVLRDYIGANVELTSGATASAVVEEYKNGTWSQVQVVTLTANLDKENKLVTVTGFDYSNADYANYGEDTPSTGARRVHVTVDGVTAEQKSAAYIVQTNTDKSGVYPNSSTTGTEALFAVPVVTVPALGSSGSTGPIVDGPDLDKGDSLTLSKGASVSTVTPSTSFSLTLEANATGREGTGIVTESTAADILLVLDNTRSMTASYGNTTRLAAMQAAAKAFVEGLPVNEASKIAMVSFTIGDRRSPTTTDVSWTPLNAGAKSTVNSKISALSAPDSTYGYDTCFTQPIQTASSLLDAVSSDGNPKYVLFFTDGSAAETVAQIQSLISPVHGKADAVFSIGITNGDSEVQKARAIAKPDTNYVNVNNAGAMNTAFQNALNIIQEDLGGSNSTLGADGIFRDVVNTDKFDVSDATATVTVMDFDSGKWTATAAKATAANGSTNSYSGAWKNKADDDGTLQIAFAADGTVTVTGFSYKDHYLLEDGTEAEGVNAQKLRVVIDGLKLKAGAQTNENQTEVPTNDADNSGIYKSDGTTMVKSFPLPTVNIPGDPDASPATVAKDASAIKVIKNWSDGNGNHNGDSVTITITGSDGSTDSHELNSGNSWQYTFTDLDPETEYTIQETANTAAGQWKTTISEPSVSTSQKTTTGWVAQSYGAVEASQTYVFTYTVNGTTYVMGRNGTKVFGSTSGLTSGVPDANIGNDYKWQISKASSYYGDWYLKNLGNNQYLAAASNYSTGNSPGTYMTSSASSYYGAMHLDDDGSIWNGYSPGYNLYATGSSVGANSRSYTAFTPYLYTNTTTTTTTLAYTITNTKIKTSVPVSFVKVEKNNNTPVPGAVFSLKQNGKMLYTLESDEHGQLRSIFDEDGEPTFELAYGTYMLTETAAPDGYVKLAKPIQISVTANGVTAYPYGGGDDYEVPDVDDGYEIVIPNERKLVSVTVKKLVDGNLADPNKEFSFTATINGEKQTFSLKHNQTYKIENLAPGTKLTVTEEAGDYTASYSAGSSSGNGSTVTVTVPEEDSTIVFTNTLSKSIETGVSLDSGPYVGILAGVTALGMTAVLAGRRRGRRTRYRGAHE